MTPRYPGATWMPVGQDCGGNNGPLACSWHEAVTTAGKQAIAGWVDQENSCHAFIGADGDMGQYKDFDRVAYGVLNGNQRGVITIETWDDLLPATGRSPNGSHGPNDFPWTDQQVARIIDVIAWMRRALGIPIHFMANTRERGHAPHRLGVPNPTGAVDVGYGPDQWTSHPGKECCGDMRIRQLRDHILPAAQARFDAGAGTLPQGPVDGTGGGTYTPGGDDSMSAQDVQDLKVFITEIIKNRTEGSQSSFDEQRYTAREVVVPAIGAATAHAGEDRRMLGVLLDWNQPTGPEGGGRRRLGRGLMLAVADDSDTGAVFAFGPGVFVHVPDPEHYIVGVDGGTYAQDVYHTNRRGLDVLWDNCLRLKNLDVQPSTIATAIVPKTYTVVKGDTWGAVCGKLNVTSAALKAANPAVTDINQISVDQVLTVPC